jgi:hypothetical protein
VSARLYIFNIDISNGVGFIGVTSNAVTPVEELPVLYNAKFEKALSGPFLTPFI